MVHFMNSQPYYTPRSPGYGPLADEEALAGFRRKRTFESLTLPLSLSPYNFDKNDMTLKRCWTPSSPVIDRLSLIEPTDSDADEFPANTPQQQSPEPSSPCGSDYAGDYAELPEGNEDNAVALAASLLLTLWSQTSGRAGQSFSKRPKFLNKLAPDDEEPYVPKNSSSVRRSKKHVNKDVRIPNSCETHKRRHLKCPLDCEERLRREAEVAAGMHDDECSIEGEAYGSGSDAEPLD